MELSPKAVLCPVGEGCGQTEQLALSTLFHLVVFITVVTYPTRPVCLEAAIGIKTQPICMVKTRVFPGE